MTKLSLTEILDALRLKIGEPYTSLNDALVARLREMGFADTALKEGDKAPDFALTSAKGDVVKLTDLLAEGPAVLSFYRGVWCPFCSAELEALHAAEPAIRAAGGRLAAITAEANGIAQRVAEERKFAFDVLCDLDNGVSLDFGLIFRVPPPMIEAFLRDGLNFPVVYGNDSWFLPVPATYILGRDGVIARSYVNPDFRYRLDPSEIVATLNGMAAR